MLQDSKFLYKEDLICRDFYNYYKENRKKSVEPIDQYKLFVKAVNGLMELLRRQILETEGGVYINGFGYFCYVKNAEKRRRVGNNLSFFQRMKKVDKYTYWFFPDNNFKDWYIEADAMKPKLDNYKLHFDGIKSYYDAKLLADNLRKYHGKQIKF